ALARPPDGLDVRGHRRRGEAGDADADRSGGAREHRSHRGDPRPGGERFEGAPKAFAEARGRALSLEDLERREARVVHERRGRRLLDLQEEGGDGDLWRWAGEVELEQDILDASVEEVSRIAPAIAEGAEAAPYLAGGQRAGDGGERPLAVI